MRIDELWVCVEVSRRRSFTAVAEDRGVDPSTISRVINQVEQRLGIRLFNRTTRTMSLTEAGSTYLTQVALLLEELEHAEEEARQVSAGPTGNLRLTTSVAFGERIVVPLIPEFSRLHPSVKLELVINDTNIDLVNEGIDLAIRLAPSLSGNIVATKLFSTQYRVVASRDYLDAGGKISHPADLSHHPCTVLSIPDYRSVWRFKKKSGTADRDICDVPIGVGVSVSSVLSLRSLVLQGGGPALLANWLVDDDIARGDLIDLFPNHEVSAADFDTAAWIVYPNRKFLPTKVRAMIDFLKSRLQDTHKESG